MMAQLIRQSKLLKTIKISFWTNTNKSLCNLGQGQARDTAINKSTGEYLAFIDSDDEWHQDKLSSCITFFSMHADKINFS